MKFVIEIMDSDIRDRKERIEREWEGMSLVEIIQQQIEDAFHIMVEVKED